MKSLKTAARISACVVALFAVSVNSGAQQQGVTKPGGLVMAEKKMKVYDALKIAVETLERRKAMYRPEFKLRAARVDNEWVFSFVFLPETPGLDVTVFVSDSGGTRVLPGI
jgi:hypothetical protein